jgi:hypothetical protein
MEGTGSYYIHVEGIITKALERIGIFRHTDKNTDVIIGAR